MKKVLVTGGCGFIGSHIVEELIESSYQVAIIDNMVTGNKKNIEGLDRVELFEHDITDPGVVELVVSINPDYIIHQAAQVSVAHSVKDMNYDEQVNIAGSLNIIKAAAACKAEKLVFASSAAVYGNPEYLPIDTEHPVSPQSPYGLSKLTVEKYLEICHELYGLDYTALRYANVYGPRQDAHGEGGVIAIFSEKIAKADAPVIYGDGEQSRDFVYVKDVAHANVQALTNGSRQVLNVSRTESITVNQLFEVMARIAGQELKPFYEEERAGDIKHSKLCNKKTISELKWNPEVGLEEGLRKTLEFYQMA
ncbi:NAD-dependent epimerase/dehydratase family protein [Bacillus mangrovi]|uniref:NAD-dependent epimerase/dehydratase family protein n=1 Tax=Metabacillus mangrovi TaxID=1491830 RepID=A0A7X2S9A0_9BACI|nr:NAD-dependent epimerase/dehydratase family protein [Metabacillus mangrovi]MTH55041.1 NAD-dependent epimerase/dehydratase family protein [Metabacillus mangrovi]